MMCGRIWFIFRIHINTEAPYFLFEAPLLMSHLNTAFYKFSIHETRYPNYHESVLFLKQWGNSKYVVGVKDKNH